MPRLRTIAVGIVLALATPIVVGMGVAGWVLWDMPPAQGERLRGPHGLVGVQSGGSYAWIVPSDSGVIVVDAGLDPSAAAIKREIGSRQVRAVLLTHGHGDHVAGLPALGDVPVYVGPGERPLLAGDEPPGGWLARWFSALMVQPPVPDDLTEITDRQAVEIDGVRLLPVHIPGHTHGSTAWLWEDVLFTGDAVLAATPPVLAPAALATDPEQAAASVRELLPLDFDFLADGHTGVVSGARSGVFRLAGERVEPPTTSVKSPEEASSGPAVHRTGRYVQAPVPGPDGLQPALLVLDDGREWVLSGAPVPEHRSLWGRKVEVRGHALATEQHADTIAGLHVDLESVTLANGEEPGDGSLPALADRAAIEGAIGQWGLVSGVVEELHPLARGAAWAEGRARLSDDSEWLVSLPADTPTDTPLVLVARVTREEGLMRLVAPVHCPVAGPCP